MHPMATAEHEEALPGSAPAKTMRQAVLQIVLADVSMSLDNVLAVAGAAAQHTWVLVIGLLLSVALMGSAAGFIASLLKRGPGIAYLGLGIILWVALGMIWEGGWQAWHASGMAPMPMAAPAPAA